MTERQRCILRNIIIGVIAGAIAGFLVSLTLSSVEAQTPEATTEIETFVYANDEETVVLARIYTTELPESLVSNPEYCIALIQTLGGQVAAPFSIVVTGAITSSGYVSDLTFENQRVAAPVVLVADLDSVWVMVVIDTNLANGFSVPLLHLEASLAQGAFAEVPAGYEGVENELAN